VRSQVTQLTTSSRKRASRLAEVDVVGEFDIETAPRLRQVVAHLIEAGYVHLDINLQGLDFLDSTGLSVLVSSLKKLRTQGGSLRLICSNQQGALLVVADAVPYGGVGGCDPTVEGMSNTLSSAVVRKARNVTATWVCRVPQTRQVAAPYRR
jgi:anti-sigma B factor antagonist